MKLEIFESTLCCPTGVCGPEPDKELIELQNVLQVLSKAGIKVDRYAINQSPLAFTKNQVVKQFIQSEGPGKEERARRLTPAPLPTGWHKRERHC